MSHFLSDFEMLYNRLKFVENLNENQSMRNERYEIKAEPNAMSFEFISVGPKGNIPKLVIYTQTAVKNVYNLAFGDKDNETGSIDDFVISDNKDSQKVLATVASTVYAFINKYPDFWVFATRLYQIGISKHLEEIAEDFIVLGRFEKEWFPFEKNISYDAFLIKFKIK
jgi:hypothetical protein